jgi:farnesyl diphosphate synthase
MVYAAGEAMGVSTDLLDIPACAVEMIHAYSLIHDDLPAMDNDDLRRGRPTCHKAFDEATAILAGDALQALAYEILAKDDHKELTPQHRIAMLSLLTEASGAHGMAGGQAVDLASVGKQLTLEQLEHMHQLKTGALIRASILLGGMCKKDISDREIQILSDYARCIGLSFQIQDDILDVISDTETLGKPQGSDEKQEKPTFPAILGLETSKQRALEQHQLALKILEPLDEKADSLRQLSAYIVERQF